jgi:ketosteroid isomerase-like protein
MTEALTISSLQRAIESRDGVTLAGFYADDAVLQIIDQDHPPSAPLIIKGHDAIAAHFEDVCGRAMTHNVTFGIAEGDRLAFTQACRYPDGVQVFCSATLEVAGGKMQICRRLMPSSAKRNPIAQACRWPAA